jgi:hypothetical protein
MLSDDAAAFGMKRKFLSRQRNILISVGVISAVKVWFKSIGPEAFSVSKSWRGIWCHI